MIINAFAINSISVVFLVDFLGGFQTRFYCADNVIPIGSSTHDSIFFCVRTFKWANNVWCAVCFFFCFSTLAAWQMTIAQVWLFYGQQFQCLLILCAFYFAQSAQLIFFFFFSFELPLDPCIKVVLFLFGIVLFTFNSKTKQKWFDEFRRVFVIFCARILAFAPNGRCSLIINVFLRN